MTIADSIKFDAHGLVVAIAQDAVSGEVLMVAYMNREALEETLETGLVHYWSRSRKKLWKKGGTSGNVQKVCSISVDCDADALLVRIEQQGAACHEGYRSCFFREVDGEDLRVTAERVFDPKKVYGR